MTNKKSQAKKTPKKPKLTQSAISRTKPTSPQAPKLKTQNLKSSILPKKTFPIFQTILAIFFFALISFTIFLIIKHTRPADYIVETNAFFAPFEFYEGNEIKGVDIEIINRVAEKMQKKIEIKNADFSVIIDNVSLGKVADAGAAGLTITDARAKKVDFSIPYYTSVQYVIYPKSAPPETKDGYILWEALTGKTLGTQTDTTGYLFAGKEIDSGVLKNTNATLKGFASAHLAADGIAAHLVDYVIVDQLPAEYIISKNSDLACLPLFYSGTPDQPTAETYAIAVNKSRPELLTAINETLTEMLKKDASGKSEIENLIIKYMNL